MAWALLQLYLTLFYIYEYSMKFIDCMNCGLFEGLLHGSLSMNSIKNEVKQNICMYEYVYTIRTMYIPSKKKAMCLVPSSPNIDGII